MTSAPGPKKKKKEKKPTQPKDSAPCKATPTAVVAAPIESQGTSASQEVTFRLDIATGLAALATAPPSAKEQGSVTTTKPAEAIPPPPESTKKEEGEEKCAVCKLTQFALEVDQGMVFCGTQKASEGILTQQTSAELGFTRAAVA